MITITEVQLNTWLAGFIWPLARILALITVTPVLSTETIPATVKIGLGMFITFIVAPLAPPPPGVEVWSAAGMLVLVEQIAIGVALGFSMRIAFTMMDLAGELAGLQMGLGFAAFFDPTNSMSTALIAQYLGILVSLVFLAINGHLLVIAMLAESFQVLPLTTELPSASLWMTLVHWGGKIFPIGLMLALPLLAALLITNLALGILTRAAPQLNVFSVGFPITLLLGFAVLLLILPQLSNAFQQPLYDGIEMMRTLMHAAQGPAASG